MDAIDPASSGDIPHDTQVIDVVPFRDSKPEIETPIVDDGKRTTMMAAVDLEALGLDPLASASGPIPVVTDDDDDNDNDKSDKSGGAGGRKKRKKR
jgi:hypothetical protein